MNSPTPTVYLIRHAKSEYNCAQESVRKKYKHLDSQKVRDEPEYYRMKFESDLDDCDILLNDPKTQQELKQCKEKMSSIDIDLIICSPLKRTLTTCYHIFDNHKSKAPVIVDPLFRQFLSSICDIGSRLQQSIKKYPDFDYSLIKNPSYWYVQTIQNRDVKEKILSNLQNIKEEDKRKAALTHTVEYIKDITKRKKNDPSVSMEITSPLDEQKKRLKVLLEKYKNIAVVTHNYNIETYTGTKTPNCGIFVYRSEFLDLPLEQIQKKYL